jgi:hypothetical protein
MDVRSWLTGRRGVSLPFTDFCEPLLAGKSAPPEVIDPLIELGRERHWKYFEVRGGQNVFGEAPASMTVFSHALDLSLSEDALFARLKESTRRNIRKAKREGVEVGIGTSREMMGDFYRLNCLTRREHGLPPQPRSFFMNLREHLLEKGLGCVVLALLRGRAIGGAVYLHFGREALYKYGASDRECLSPRPNDLVTWEAIRWYRSRGLQRLGFGRTELDHESLRRYKLGWGATETRRPYYRYDLQAGRFVASSLNRPGASAAIIRRLPTCVSRAVGTALYRHVA